MPDSADTQKRTQDSVFSGEVFVLQKQSLVDQARYIRQQPHPLVVAHREEMSFEVSRRIGAMGNLAIRATAEFFDRTPTVPLGPNRRLSPAS